MALTDTCAFTHIRTHKLQALVYDSHPWRKVPESEARRVTHTPTPYTFARVCADTQQGLSLTLKLALFSELLMIFTFESCL